jgi:hypothetical protein
VPSGTVVSVPDIVIVLATPVPVPVELLMGNGLDDSAVEMPPADSVPDVTAVPIVPVVAGLEFPPPVCGELV